MCSITLTPCCNRPHRQHKSLHHTCAIACPLCCSKVCSPSLWSSAAGTTTAALIIIRTYKMSLTTNAPTVKPKIFEGNLFSGEVTIYTRIAKLWFANKTYHMYSDIISCDAMHGLYNYMMNISLHSWLSMLLHCYFKKITGNTLPAVLCSAIYITICEN